MKRISILLILLSLFAAPVVRAQDAATEERLNKLAGQVQDLIAAQEALQKKIEALQGDLRDLHDQLNNANGQAVSRDELKRLAEEIQKVDRNRVADYERIVSKIEDLGKAVVPPPAPPKTRKPPADEAPPASVSDKGYEHVVKKGENLSLIAQAYREKNVKVTVKDILQANPGLDPNRLQVGQKVFIPAPKQ
jgi:LysM repeat protein